MSSKVKQLFSSVLYIICSYLDVPDVLSFCLSSKSFKFLLNDKVIWTYQLKNYINVELIIDKPKKSEDPKIYFRKIYTIYSQIRKKIEHICLKVASNSNIREILNKNFFQNKKHRETVEQIIMTDYHEIPLEYYFLFRLANGQDSINDGFPDYVCFFGGHYYQKKYYEFEFVPLAMAESILFQKLYFATLGKCAEYNLRYFVDLHNILKRGYGMIFTLLNQQEVEGGWLLTLYTISPNLLTFLEKIEHSNYNENREMIDLYNTLNKPEVDVTESGIRVRMSTFFNPWVTSELGFVFAYQIRISSSGTTKLWQLSEHTWTISEGGTQRELGAAGLGGKFPEIFESCEDFVYESCFFMQSLKGGVRGELTFICPSSLEETVVEIPSFSLGLPKGHALLNFNTATFSIKVIAENVEKGNQIEME